VSEKKAEKKMIRIEEFNDRYQAQFTGIPKREERSRIAHCTMAQVPTVHTAFSVPLSTVH
jgi:hypothetical protein